MIYAPLALLLLVGLALRVLALLAYEPAVLLHYDSIAYLDAAHTGLFDDPIRPAGYAAFLRLVSLLGDELQVTVAAQHLLGLATATLLYLAARRAEVSRGLALVPAAVVLLSGDQLFLEHSLLSEALFSTLVAAALYAAARAPEGGRAWAVTAAALVALATMGRAVGVFLLPVLGLWLLFALPRPWRRSLGGAALAMGTAAALLAGYAGLRAAAVGEAGLSSAGGWSLYGRAAPFADCGEFDPPVGTRALCETTPPSERPGPDFYAWVGASPARRLYGGPPRANSEVGAFGRAAILAQPSDYLAAVGKDLVRYVDPDFGRDRPFSGEGPAALGFERRDPTAERAVQRTVRRFYSAPRLRLHDSVDLLADYQRIARVHGALLLALLLLAAAGAAVASPSLRRQLLLFAAVALALLVVPPLTSEYTARYAVPATGPLAAAAALGAGALASRLRDRGRRGQSRRSSGSPAA